MEMCAAYVVLASYPGRSGNEANNLAPSLRTLAYKRMREGGIMTCNQLLTQGSEKHNS